MSKVAKALAIRSRILHGGMRDEEPEPETDDEDEDMPGLVGDRKRKCAGGLIDDEAGEDK